MSTRQTSFVSLQWTRAQSPPPIHSFTVVSSNMIIVAITPVWEPPIFFFRTRRYSPNKVNALDFLPRSADFSTEEHEVNIWPIVISYSACYACNLSSDDVFVEYGIVIARPRTFFINIESRIPTFFFFLSLSPSSIVDFSRDRCKYIYIYIHT